QGIEEIALPRAVLPHQDRQGPEFHVATGDALVVPDPHPPDERDGWGGRRAAVGGRRIAHGLFFPTRPVPPQGAGAFKPSTRAPGPQTSRFLTSRACFSMNARRGSTSSPIRVLNRSLAAAASSSRTCSSVRRDGSIVVSQSCSASISPSPLNRVILIPFSPS